jgi:non-reducing end alpha-L-arabinofuranosidase
MRVAYLAGFGLLTLACSTSVNLGQRWGQGGQDTLAAGGSVGGAGSGGRSSENPTGGAPATGGVAPATGGVPAAMGGATPNATGGVSPLASGGSIAVATGGRSPSTGGAGTGGGGPATGGAEPTGGSTAAATGGSVTGGTKATGGSVTAATGGGSNVPPVIGPCDIYAAASPVTPCVAAYSTTRLLNSSYSGPLYQVRKGGSSSGSGGTLTDINATADGFADGAAHDAACGTSGCTFSILYDQSGKGNNLKVAPAGCYSGTASQPDYESSAVKKSVQISGHKVYALYMNTQEGYRNNSPAGATSGSASQGVYEVADGTHVGTACCWDFGIASKNNCYGATGTMNAIYFGTGYWGKGAGSGPWFMGDFEAGVWATGSGASSAVNSNLPSSTMPFAFGILKTDAQAYAIRVGNGQSGSLTTAYDGAAPATFATAGGIILGVGGDNSNSSQGTFFEGAIASGRPSDTTDAAVLANIQAAKYGQ